MITNFETSRRGNKLRVSLRLSNGSWGHGEGDTVKQAKRAAIEDAKSKPAQKTQVWRADG